MSIRHIVLFCLTLMCLPLSAQQRIISLAPHTTELLYALGAGNRLIAVSDYSDYPPAATSLPSVANHNGVDFEQIIRLQPDLIVAWQGGNKPQDLAKLASLGFDLYLSKPHLPLQIADDIQALGRKIGQTRRAQHLSEAFKLALNTLSKKYAGLPDVRIFYYMWPSPLMTIGQDAWANHLLTLCGATNIFADSVIAYPEVNLEQVARRQPQKIIAALNVSQQDANSFWRTKQGVIDAPLVVVNPDKLHRFTPRLLDGLGALCEKIHAID